MSKPTTKPAAPKITPVRPAVPKTPKPKTPKIIAEAAPESAFWMNNGPIVRNLVELKDALAAINDELFDYHTKRDGNNFSKWIDEVLKNAECAKKLQNAHTRQEAIRIIERYI